jgi:hypothetical protein
MVDIGCIERSPALHHVHVRVTVDLAGMLLVSDVPLARSDQSLAQKMHQRRIKVIEPLHQGLADSLGVSPVPHRHLREDRLVLPMELERTTISILVGLRLSVLEQEILQLERVFHPTLELVKRNGSATI